MKIVRNHDNIPTKGPAATFAGHVRVDSYFQGDAPSKISAGIVTFEPGARTAWHTHPLGQLLLVTFGEGWVQKEGEERLAVQPGDTVWFEPHEKHWHGASDRKAMTHVAIAEADETGSATVWMEHVSDADYLG